MVARDFTASAPDEKWLADITYIRTNEGWLYLAAVLDIYSRKIVGWTMGNRITQGLVIRAIKMAISKRDPVPGLICHSDRGVQYAGVEYQEIFEKSGIISSMSRKSNCWDNAPMKLLSQFERRTYKWEGICHQKADSDGYI